MLVAIGAPGCGARTPFPVAPVSGKVVSADGKPLDALRMTVVFVPKVTGPEGAVRGGRGNVNLEDGAFEITTFDFGDGAAVGTNGVGIEVMAKNHALTRPKFALLGESKPVTSVEVKPGKNYFEFKLLK